MHIPLTCKLATKQLQIKRQSKGHKQPLNQENYTKIEKFMKNFHENM